MRIKIGEYILKSDSMSFVLVKESKRIDKNGNKVDDIIGYYSTIESAFKAVPERALMMSDATDLKSLVTELREYRRILEDGLM